MLTPTQAHLCLRHNSLSWASQGSKPPDVMPTRILTSERFPRTQRPHLRNSTGSRSRPSLAIRQIRAFEEFGLLFCEEPVPPDNLDALAELRKKTMGIDLAAGERPFTRWGIKTRCSVNWSM